MLFRLTHFLLHVIGQTLNVISGGSSYSTILTGRRIGDTTTLINTHAALETNMSVGIEWDDSDNYDRIRPEEMQFELYAEYEDSETGEVKSEKVEGRSARLEKDDWKTVKQEGLPV